MNYSFKNFFQNLYEQQGQQFAFNAKTENEFNLWKKNFRNSLKELLGLSKLEQFGKNVTCKNPQLLQEFTRNGILYRKYMLETLPEIFMPFYMLIPDTVLYGDKARAMITIPAHGANKNTVCGIAQAEEEEKKIADAPDECYGLIFAQKGYIVFCPDPPGYGERVEPMPTEDRCFGNRQKRSCLDCSCKDLAQTAEALGLSLTAIEIWELQKLLDFACSRPEIMEDENGIRIGCAGFSGGGQYSMWLAAMDDRIRLSVISGYIHSYPDSILDCHLCPCNYAPSLWTLGDISDICSLIAPRPLFAENGMEDIENGSNGIAGPISQMAKIKKAYLLFHCEEVLMHCTPPGIHKWYGECYSFVNDNL